MSVSVTAGGSAGDDVKEFLRKKCEKVIQSKVADYITALKRGECVYFGELLYFLLGFFHYFFFFLTL